MFRISYDVVNVSAEYIKERTTYRPEIGIICGSGLGKNTSTHNACVKI